MLNNGVSFFYTLPFKNHKRVQAEEFNKLRGLLPFKLCCLYKLDSVFHSKYFKWNEKHI